MEAGALAYIRGGSEDEDDERKYDFLIQKNHATGYYAESTQRICIHQFLELN